MKNNEKTLARQQKHLKSNIIHPWIELDPVAEIKKYTYLKRTLFNKLIWMGRVWKDTEPSQQYLADKLGCHRVTINRLIQDLLLDGVLSYVYRHRHTSVYYVHDFFRQPHIRNKLKFLLPAIRTIGLFLGLLTSQSYPPMLHHINKRFNKRDYNNVSYYYNLSLLTSYCNSSRVRICDARERPSQERVMFDIQVFRSYIQRLTKLNVSTWGAIKLSAFPKEVLGHCAQEIEREEHSLSTYNHYFNACWKYCQEREIPISINLIAERGAHANVSPKDSVLQHLVHEPSIKKEIPQQEQFRDVIPLKPRLPIQMETELEALQRINIRTNPQAAAHWLTMFPPPKEKIK